MSYEAEPGNHDDLTMCLVLFAWLSEQQYFKHLTDIDTLMKLREKDEEEIENDMLPFGFINNNPMREVEMALDIHNDEERWEIVPY